MSEIFKGWIIGCGFLTGHLFDEERDIDVVTSANNYANVLRERLHFNFPEADISVTWKTGNGDLPIELQTFVGAPSRLGISWERLKELQGVIEDIKQDVWSDPEDWLIYETR